MKNRRGAFSLIELLLAMTIFVVIGVSLYRVFSAGIAAAEKVKETHVIYQEARRVFHDLAQDLENMVFYDYSGSYPQKKAFEWGENKISFIIATSEGLQVIRYYLMEPPKERIHKVLIGRHETKNKTIVIRQEQRTSLFYLIRESSPIIKTWQNVPEREKRQVLSRHAFPQGLKFICECSSSDQCNKNDTLPQSIRVQLTLQSKDSIVNFERNILIPLALNFISSKRSDENSR